MKKSEMRTIASGIVYWMSFGILVLLTVRSVAIAWNSGSNLTTFIDGPALWIPLISIVMSPLPITIATVSHYIRSGATIWLIGILAIQILPNISLINEEIQMLDSPAFVFGRVFAMVSAMAVILATYIFLTKRGELRNP